MLAHFRLHDSAMLSILFLSYFSQTAAAANVQLFKC